MATCTATGGRLLLLVAVACAVDALERTTAFLLDASTTRPNDALAGATPYLRLFALARGGTALARGALAAHRLSLAGKSDSALPARIATARFFAENIAAGFLSFTETLKQWEDSAGHRANLLMPGAKKVGVASVANARSPYRMFWAMVITD